LKIDSTYYNYIIAKFDSLLKREIIVNLLNGILQLVTTVLAVLLMGILFEYLFNFTASFRTLIFFSFLMMVLVLIVYFVILPLVRTFLIKINNRYRYASEKVAKFFPQIKDELLNVMQLVNIKENTLYSSGLINAAFLDVYSKVQPLNFDTIISFDRTKKLAKVFLFFFLTVLAIISFSSEAQSAFMRLVNYSTEFIPPQKFYFNVIPGDANVTKGEDVFIKITASGDRPSKIQFHIKDETQTSFSNETLYADSLNEWTYNIRSIRNNLFYFVSSEGIKSKEYKIEVIDRPIIQSLSLKIVPPAYSGLPVVDQSDNGNITGLAGSSVTLSILSSKALNSAKIIFNDTTTVTMLVNGKKGSGRFTLRKDNSYWLNLLDETKNHNLSPITYSIKVLSDLPPSIDMISPNRNVNLSDDQRLPISVKIEDDYGFSKLIINYRLSASRYELPQENFTTVEIPFTSGQKEQLVNHIWNLSKFNLATEDVISYYLEVFDNDNFSGPKSAKTGLFTVRIPSIEEIFANADKSQDMMEKELVETLKEADELKKELDKISKDLKQDKKDLTWQEKEKIEKTMESFEKLQEKVDEISQKLEETKNELQQNNLLSEKTLEKYMELQKLMNEMTSEEMKKTMEKLQQALQNMDRKQTQEALQNMKFDEEQFQKSIERTLNLLKRIQIEQKMDEVVRRAEDLQKKQENVEEQTQNTNMQNQQQRNELAKKQDEISKDLKKLEDEMKELQDKMDDFSDMPNSDMEKLNEEMEQQKNEELSKEASEQLKNQQKQNAQKSQKQLSKNMQKMKQSLMQMQQQMAQQNQMQTLVDLMKVLNNLISLSKQQEELKNRSQTGDQSSMNSENAKEQSNLKANLEKLMNQLSELSQKTFAVTPEMGKALGDARREMDKAIDAMQNRNSNMTANNQGESMKTLNEAAAMMKGSMDSMMQPGGQGGGMMSLMQQLGKMGQQQMQLNNMTQMLQQMMSGQMSPEQQGQLQRLAQQQELIQKSLEQLNKEAKESGKSKNLPANLQEILNQMREVVTDMKTDNLDDNIVQKQERILSKLLDAQRSINERDFEKERESNTGQNITRQSPSELNLKNRSNKDNLRNELYKVTQEGYSKDYEDLIKKYYESLQKIDKQ
jgi:hypothetical protein